MSFYVPPRVCVLHHGFHNFSLFWYFNLVPGRNRTPSLVTDENNDALEQTGPCCDPPITVYKHLPASPLMKYNFPRCVEGLHNGQGHLVPTLSSFSYPTVQPTELKTMTSVVLCSAGVTPLYPQVWIHCREWLMNRASIVLAEKQAHHFHRRPNFRVEGSAVSVLASCLAILMYSSQLFLFS